MLKQLTLRCKMKNKPLKFNEMGSIHGRKGGGGSPRAPVEASDTLRNNTFVQSLELLGEGQINGLHTGDGRSIFINGTPLQNTDASYNFNGARFTVRTGTLSQTYIPGFESTTNTVTAGTTVTTSVPYTYTVSSINVDALRPTFIFGGGIKAQNTSNGDTNGSSVSYTISRKLTSSGTWVPFYTGVKSGKANSAYSWQIYIPRPTGTSGTWDIRITRNTADSVVASVVNSFAISQVVEIDEVKLAYPGYAYVGMSLDAQTFGNTIPTRSYLIDGVNIQIPNNYNPTTGVFTGLWSGSFVNGFSNDPAWVLYDLLTNPTYGCAAYGIISASNIDKFSFYNASVFNNALVNDGFGGTERRFTFDAAVTARTDMLTTLTMVAGMMNASLVHVNGLLTLNQDRPSTPSLIVNNSNVIDGMFTYHSTPLAGRTTSVNVAYSNKNNSYLPAIASVTADSTATSWLGFDAVSRFGFNPVNVAAYGATTQGQATRMARYMLYTDLHQTEIVEFSMGMYGLQINIGDIVSLHDYDYTNQQDSGRVVSSTATTITLDRPVIINGASSISVVLQDGVTYETHAITNGTGTYTTLTIAGTGTTLNQQTGVSGTATGGWTVNPAAKCLYNITTDIAPRAFRIVDIKQNGNTPEHIDFTGVLYIV